MQRNILKYSTISLIIFFFTLGCSKTKMAQEVLKASTTSNSQLVKESSAEDESPENLDYMVDTWSSAVTREEVSQITSILDFWSNEDKDKYKLDAFKEVWVVNLKDYPDWQRDLIEIEPQNKAYSPTAEYTQEQLDLVANANYNDHLRFSARFNSTKIETGEIKEYVLISQSMSLVPDVQATYKGGIESLVDYLKQSSKDYVKLVKRDAVGRCRIFFTVTNTGSIADVKLIESSNYPDVDEAMVNIIKSIPQKWTPAQDENGEKFDQEFVFTFGKAGC